MKENRTPFRPTHYVHDDGAQESSRRETTASHRINRSKTKWRPSASQKNYRYRAHLHIDGAWGALFPSRRGWRSGRAFSFGRGGVGVKSEGKKKNANAEKDLSFWCRHGGLP